MGLKTLRDEQLAIRPLSKQEIDRRIELLVSEVAAMTESGERREVDPDAAVRPRWISAGELVRRLRPFVVHN